MSRPVIVEPGEGDRVGNVEFPARTRDTPRFNFGIIEMAPRPGFDRRIGLPD